MLPLWNLSYDGEDIFAHEMDYHTIHKRCGLLYDMLYSGVQGVESKRNVWDISHMQNRLLAEGKLMYFQMTISRKLVFTRVAGQGRELKF